MTIRRKGLIALIALVGAAVFYESYGALTRVAKAGARPTPELWPTALEAVMIILVLMEWEAREQHKPSRYIAGIRALFGLAVGLSTLLQVLDAPSNWKGWLTAGITPLALFLVVEILLAVIYSTKRVGTVPEQMAVVEREIARLRDLVDLEARRSADAARARTFLLHVPIERLALPAPADARQDHEGKREPAPKPRREEGAATSPKTSAPIPSTASTAPPRKVGRPALRSVSPAPASRKRQSTADAEATAVALRGMLPVDVDATSPEAIWSALDPADRAALTVTVLQALTGLSRATAGRRLAALREQPRGEASA